MIPAHHELALVRRSTSQAGWEGVEGVHLDPTGWTTWAEEEPTPDQVAYIERCTGRLASLGGGACFMNSQQLVLWTDFSQRLQYAEGIGRGYADAGTPFLHAWLVLDGTVLVDVTWRRQDGTSSTVVGTWTPEPRVYRGRTFSRDEVHGSVATGMWTSLLSPEPVPPRRRGGRRSGGRR